MKAWRNTYIIAILIFIGLSGWWVANQFLFKGSASAEVAFPGLYGVAALFGGVAGLVISQKWGGYKSLIGRAIMMFSIGLLAQEFGQLAYAYYADVKHIDIPYPSIGDIGYFGSVVLYGYGISLIARASGSKFSLKLLGNKILAFLLPIAMLAGSYAMFLRGYEFDWAHPLTVFLDFGYPLGEAVYISLAVLAFFLSWKLLGGMMKKRILLVIGALVFQYAADFNFLFQNSHETWVNGAYGDYLYLVAYFVMTLAVIGFGSALVSLNSANEQKEQA